MKKTPTHNEAGRGAHKKLPCAGTEGVQDGAGVRLLESDIDSDGDGFEVWSVLNVHLMFLTRLGRGHADVLLDHSLGVPELTSGAESRRPQVSVQRHVVFNL